MEGILPIGSIVTLKNNSTKIFIIGYLPDDMRNRDFHDYIGITSTLSLDGTKLVYNKNEFIFNNEDIENIYFIGYQDKKFDLMYRTFKSVKLDYESFDKELDFGDFFNGMLNEFKKIRKVRDEMLSEDDKNKEVLS